MIYNYKFSMENVQKNKPNEIPNHLARQCKEVCATQGGSHWGQRSMSKNTKVKRMLVLNRHASINQGQPKVNQGASLKNTKEVFN